MAQSAVGPFRWTRTAYGRAAAAGVFEGRRVELLGGEIVEMAPEGPRHAVRVSKVADLLRASLPAEAGHVREAHPLALDPYGEPEPDIAVVRGRRDDYETEHPTAADTLLIVEVGDSLAAYDRGTKADEYAAAGIEHYWVVVLGERLVAVMSDPQPSEASLTGWRYARREHLVAGQSVTPPIPGATPISVAELVPAA
jgi:Uma2 family endonuclease